MDSKREAYVDHLCAL